MDSILREIRRLVKPIGEMEIRRSSFTVYIGGDQATFNRTPEEMTEAKTIIEQDYYSAEKSMKNEIVGVAVKWWCDQLAAPSFPDTGDIGNDLFIATHSLSSSLTDVDIERFKAVLTNKLTEQGQKDEIILMTDYGPKDLLEEVAIEAGIGWREFPFKTIMWIEDAQISVRAGYGAGAVTIYPVES